MHYPKEIPAHCAREEKVFCGGVHAVLCDNPCDKASFVIIHHTKFPPQLAAHQIHLVFLQRTWARAKTIWFYGSVYIYMREGQTQRIIIKYIYLGFIDDFWRNEAEQVYYLMQRFLIMYLCGTPLLGKRGLQLKLNAIGTSKSAIF